jgi:RNA polymerase sigma-70 factor (ECF subfamily)
VSKRFETTRWSVVLKAQQGSTRGVRQALSTLLEAYWEPIYAYIRRRGYTVEEAEDLTQGYFLLLLEKDYLDGVHPSKGRLRSFLLASAKHFLANEWDKEQALKRGGGIQKIPLDTTGAEGRYREHAVEALSPDKVFERQWALAVLERALEGLRCKAVEAGTDRQFERLRPYLVGGEVKTPYKSAAEDLGMSEGAVKTAVHRLRRRFGRLLRAEIAETVAQPEDVDAELRHLLEVLAD